MSLSFVQMPNECSSDWVHYLAYGLVVCGCWDLPLKGSAVHLFCKAAKVPVFFDMALETQYCMVWGKRQHWEMKVLLIHRSEWGVLENHFTTYILIKIKYNEWIRTIVILGSIKAKYLFLTIPKIEYCRWRCGQLIVL